MNEGNEENLTSSVPSSFNSDSSVLVSSVQSTSILSVVASELALPLRGRVLFVSASSSSCVSLDPELEYCCCRFCSSRDIFFSLESPW